MKHWLLMNTGQNSNSLNGIIQIFGPEHQLMSTVTTVRTKKPSCYDDRRGGRLDVDDVLLRRVHYLDANR